MVNGFMLHRSRIFVPKLLWVVATTTCHGPWCWPRGVVEDTPPHVCLILLPERQQVSADFVQGGSSCQHNKTEHLHPVGLLQLRNMAHSFWADFAMDFNECFSKYVHFIVRDHPNNVTSVAHAFSTIWCSSIGSHAPSLEGTRSLLAPSGSSSSTYLLSHSS